MPKPKIGLLLVNLGTPDAPRTPEVRTYLREFLSDPRVVDIPTVARQLLLNAVILPTRPPKSAAAYREVWMDRGSPLLVHGRDLAARLRDRLGPSVPVALGMRYGNPSIASALAELSAQSADRVVLMPLFPQYSSAAYGSAVEKAFVEGAKAWNVPVFDVVPPFYDHPGYIDAFVAQARPVIEDVQPDKIVISFHGVPERHCTKSDPSGSHCLKSAGCCDAIVIANRYCYRAQCFETARLLADRLEVPTEAYEVTFQSRLGRTPWIQPYTDVRIEELPKEGARKVVVLSPSFVADCLETLEEIGIRAREDFEGAGGERLELVPSLNATDLWVDGVLSILSEHGIGAPSAAA